MSLFKKSNKIETNEHKLNELAIRLQFNPRYYEEKELHKLTRAIKAYKKAGFVHSNTAYNEYEKAICYYMVLNRDKFFCNL